MILVILFSVFPVQLHIICLVYPLRQEYIMGLLFSCIRFVIIMRRCQDNLLLKIRREGRCSWTDVAMRQIQ